MNGQIDHQLGTNIDMNKYISRTHITSTRTVISTIETHPTITREIEIHLIIIREIEIH